MPPEMPLVTALGSKFDLRRARILDARTAIAGQHVRPALLDRIIIAVPFDHGRSGRHHRAPGRGAMGPAGGNIEAEHRCQNRYRKSQPHDGFPDRADALPT